MSLVTVSNISWKTSTTWLLSSCLFSNCKINAYIMIPNNYLANWLRTMVYIYIYKQMQNSNLTKNPISLTNWSYRVGRALIFHSLSRSPAAMCVSTSLNIWSITLESQSERLPQNENRGSHIRRTLSTKHFYQTLEETIKTLGRILRLYRKLTFFHVPLEPGTW